MSKSEDGTRRMLAKGPWHFIFVRGMLGWGGFMAVFTFVILHFAAPELYGFTVVASLAFFPLGIVWGILTYGLLYWWLRRRDARVEL